MNEDDYPPEIAKYLSKRTPNNTQRVNEASITALTTYMISEGDIRDDLINDHDQHMIQPTLDDPVLRKEAAIRLLKRRLFIDAVPGENVPVSIQENIRRELIPFVVSYKSRRTRKAVSPTSMKTYVLGLQRTFAEWGFKLTFVSGPIFDHKTMDCVLYAITCFPSNKKTA